jgi:hypothetical protein
LLVFWPLYCLSFHLQLLITLLCFVTKWPVMRGFNKIQVTL